MNNFCLRVLRASFFVMMLLVLSHFFLLSADCCRLLLVLSYCIFLATCWCVLLLLFDCSEVSQTSTQGLPRESWVRSTRSRSIDAWPGDEPALAAPGILYSFVVAKISEVSQNIDAGSAQRCCLTVLILCGSFSIVFSFCLSQLWTFCIHTCGCMVWGQTNHGILAVQQGSQLSVVPLRTRPYVIKGWPDK